jgi:hypothetical protein
VDVASKDAAVRVDGAREIRALERIGDHRDAVEAKLRRAPARAARRLADLQGVPEVVPQ